jgi:hypothetical protein
MIFGSFPSGFIFLAVFQVKMQTAFGLGLSGPSSFAFILI